MKPEKGRTYDFYRATQRTARSRSNRQVSELLVDGWSAYYRWLAQLKERLPAGATRQRD